MNAINSLLEKDISTQFHVPEFILFGAEQHFTVWTSRGGVYRIHGGQWALTHPQPNTRTCVISLDPQKTLRGRCCDLHLEILEQAIRGAPSRGQAV